MFALAAAHLRAGFGIWTGNIREIFRFGLVPHLALTLILGAVGRTNRLIIGADGLPVLYWPVMVPMMIIGGLLGWLVIARWVRFYLLDEVTAEWWSILPGKAIFVGLWSYLKLIVLWLLLYAAIVLSGLILVVPFQMLAGQSMVAAIGAAIVMIVLAISMIGVQLFGFYLSVRLAPYILANIAGWKWSMKQCWSAMAGKRAWALFIALFVSFGLYGVIVPALIVLLSRAVGALSTLDFSVQGIVVAYVTTANSVYGVVLLQILGLFSTPVFVVVVADALKRAVDARALASPPSEVVEAVAPPVIGPDGTSLG